MTQYHAVMLDETQCEFGVTFEAANRQEAYDSLAEMYPESRVVQLEDPEQRASREQATYEYVQRCLDDPYYDIDHYDEYRYEY